MARSNLLKSRIVLRNAPSLLIDYFADLDVAAEPSCLRIALDDCPTIAVQWRGGAPETQLTFKLPLYELSTLEIESVLGLAQESPHYGLQIPDPAHQHALDEPPTFRACYSRANPARLQLAAQLTAALFSRCHGAVLDAALSVLLFRQMLDDDEAKERD